MLRKEYNDLLTQTDPGTSMGDMFRQYWVPALLASELAENDCDPVRVKLLGERLIAFRDTEGRYGLMDEFCAHRGVSLWFGRNEEGGLRCPYHGWKYDHTGQCIEVPSESAESGFCQKVKLRSYPLIKVGDVLWTHMGSEENRPPEPAWEFANLPPEQTYTSKRWQECNWLQAMEGGIDSSHVSFLHSGSLKTDPLFKGAKGNQYNQNDKKPVFEVVESDGGLYIGARRMAEDDHYYWRITPWVMPSFTMVPPRGDHPVHGHFWIPIDDENCWAWSFDYHPTRALTDKERQAMIDGYGVHNQYVPGTFRPRQNKDNDYLMDREAQRRGETYSGIWGIAMQDASLQESMGPIVDRTKENLVSTDNGIIMARHRLRKACEALRDKGIQPPGLVPEHQQVRSAARVLPPDQPFKDAMKDDLTVRPGVKQTSV
ncbi:aromatic ring-hydroxylating dioxygenase subunit alpha [Roseibium marinum]|uniref:Phenylpropionate dioxygenase-like ring-hydroxylating dioxygenase large terminal subunit n=1 Tax=Roseibium marinum TaxID=281252 RepID=A0A2S3V3J1_9HYPH|nr:aromatic ring-hydroxylating dioxygenase subunit alpha [Roseibium marinum]POF34521.1 phenylpropionate dioxygenase-like ring-hydroxylating dioxygenase large terminal subunit [Roseibium marinum]